MSIGDVAKRAAVSRQTVSNVINQRSFAMRKETRERVLQAMQELGYHPSASARGLRSRRSFSIGFVAVDPAERFLSDPFHGLVLSGIADAVREHHYSLVVHGVHDIGEGSALTEPFLQRRADGAVVTIAGSPEMRQRCISLLGQVDGPVVLLEQQAQGENLAAILSDNRGGGVAIAQYLVDKGHRRIGLLTGDTAWPAVDERIGGCREVLDAAGVSMDEAWIRRTAWTDSSAAEAAVIDLIRSHPNIGALVCANDLLAIHALRAARVTGRRVPDDLAITGFDDFDFAAYVSPQLTTVRVPGYEMGRRGAEMILRALSEGSLPADRELVLPTTLIVRESA